MEQPIVAGIASFGMSGKIFHAPLISSHRNFKLKRIIERTRNEARQLYPGVIVSRSFEDLLQDSEIELIIVNTPDETHFEYATACLKAGKHVVVEKPFTQTVAQGEELIALARQQGTVLSIFQNRRWDGDFLTVQHIVNNRMLGRLVDYEAHFDRYRNFIQQDTWKERAAAGSGVLTNLGAHMIDQALVLFGMPEAVTAHLKTMRTGGEVDDWYDIRLHYPGVNVQLKSSLLVREPGPRYLLHGTLGSFLKWGLDPQEEALKQGKNPNDPGWGIDSKEWWGVLNTEMDHQPIREKFETLPGNYRSFYDNIAARIREGKELQVKPEEALNVIRIIEAAKRSSGEKKTITLAF
ncbi:MAG: oxidoreductase [Ignavibacteriae bacterium]|nr:MAG: oxidoreductase [Ignavibacteriota bacterium]